MFSALCPRRLAVHDVENGPLLLESRLDAPFSERYLRDIFHSMPKKVYALC